MRRHGFAAASTILAIVCVVLLAVNLEHPAVFVALAAIVLSLVGGAVGASHHRG
jgi:hypothetical protein